MDILGRAGRIIAKIISGGSKGANAVALTVLMVMAFFTLADVIGRSGFNKPISGAYEFTELLFVIVVALALGYSAILGSHVRIDIIVSRFPKKAQFVIDAISYFVSSAFFLIASWRVALQAIRVESQDVTSGILGIPLYPFNWVLAFGFFLVGLMFLVISFKFISKKANGELSV
jgi:TRAP-type C4-dicarboxylate transport system permease small subunit